MATADELPDHRDPYADTMCAALLRAATARGAPADEIALITTRLNEAEQYQADRADVFMRAYWGNF